MKTELMEVEILDRLRKKIYFTQKQLRILSALDDDMEGGYCCDLNDQITQIHSDLDSIEKTIAKSYAIIGAEPPNTRGIQ